MKHLKLLLLSILVLGFTQAAYSQKSADSVRSRLSQIFYWQIADDLKLSAQQEKDLVAFIEDIQSRREKVLKDRSQALADIKAQGVTLSAAQSTKLLDRYRVSVEQLGKLDVEEFTKLNKLLGSEKFVRFLGVRETMADRINDAMKSGK